MTILSPLRYLIGVHLSQKGFTPSITVPVNNILRLIDEELIGVGYDFINPAISREVERLEDAILGVERGIDEISDLPLPLDSPVLEDIFPEDPLSFLDQDSER